MPEALVMTKQTFLDFCCFARVTCGLSEPPAKAGAQNAIAVKTLVSLIALFMTAFCAFLLHFTKTKSRIFRLITPEKMLQAQPA